MRDVALVGCSIRGGRTDVFDGVANTGRHATLIVALFILASCAPRAVPPNAATSSIFSVKLERAGDPGSAGTYNLVFFHDGTAAYIGRSSVKRVGVFVGSIPFAKIAATVDNHNIEKYGHELSRDLVDGDFLRLTITRTNGQTISMTTHDADSLPSELKALVAELDAFGRQVSWRDAAKLGPPMGTYIYADDDRAISVLERYPGGSPTRAEAFTEDFGHNPCNPPGGASVGSGTIVLREILDARQSYAVASVPRPINLTVEGRKLRASGALNQLYSPTSTRDAEGRIDRFFDDIMGRDNKAKVYCHHSPR